MATTFVEDTPWKINIVHENDLVDLLPLLQGYCEFYYQTEEISRTSDELLLSVSRALIASPKQETIPLLVRHVQDGKAVAITEDLYVDQSYRGQGIADLLIGKCARYAREHGALCLTWQTSVKNHHAQAVCDRCGAMKSDRWLNYTLPL